jgi:hypothetical protein
MKKQIELEAIKQQLEYTLEELQKKRSDKNLMHDWITEALRRVKNLNKPPVINCKPKTKKVNKIIDAEKFGKICDIIKRI